MHLDSYGKNQKIYDAFSNEWDCCEEFCPDEFPDDDGIDDDFPMMPPPSSAVQDQAIGFNTPLTNPPVPANPMSLMPSLCAGWIALAQEDHSLLTSKSLESY